MNKVIICAKEYPSRVTMGAMIDFKHETGKDVNEIGADIEQLTMFMYCCVRSACRADKVDFQLTFEQFADGILPKIHISGCPSSCGTHQIGVIGFRGGAKTIDKVLKPAFNLYINGSDIQGQERMGEEVGTLLEEQIPDFLCALGHAVSDSGMDFDTWFAKNPEGIKAIAASFLV